MRVEEIREIEGLFDPYNILSGYKKNERIRVTDKTQYFQKLPEDFEWFDSSGEQSWKSDIQQALRNNWRILMISSEDGIWDEGLVFIMG